MPARPCLPLVGILGLWLAGCGGGTDLDGSAYAAPVVDSSTVRFAIDATKRFPISPWVYGINEYEKPADETSAPWPRNIPLSRFGGNRLTAYNWENNASNAGMDWNYQNDDYLGGGTKPGEAVRMRVAGAALKGAGTIVTVPILGYVARDIDGTSVGTDPTTLRARLAARFVRSEPRKGAPFADPPEVSDDVVYQDEFVHWLTRRFPGATGSPTTPLFFSLDNEPDLWSSTHEELRPKVDGKYSLLTYDDLIDRTVAHARAIKEVAPDAMIFGPVTGVWSGAARLGRWPTPDPRYGQRFFLDVYLERMREAERAEGRRLLDVLDIHWYPEMLVDGQRILTDNAPQTPAMIEARVQAPRSLWDSTYDERSWVSEVQGGPIRLLPLLREKIAAFYPGTKIAVTEYYYGRGGDISGGIAQADVLGIFGREGVFAATLWPIPDLTASPYGGSPERALRYVIGAFRMFRDFDGKRGAFGSVGLEARSSDPVGTSVYASTDDASTSRLVVVAINKRDRPREARISVPELDGWRTAEVYTLTAAAPGPERAADLPLGSGTAIAYTMPPMSVSTIVLRR